MGSGISDVIGSIGSIKNAVADKWGPQFDDDEQVKGTGQTVGDLKNIGYSNGDLQKMGAQPTSGGVGAGIGAGLQSGLQAQDDAKARIARSRGGTPITAPQPVGQVTTPNLDYLNAARARFAVPSAFYGGK